MYVVYGPVAMQVTRLLAYETEVVMDESRTDYLYTKHRVSVEALVGLNSGQSWGVAPDQFVGIFPAFQGGFGSGVNSVVALRHALSQPRLPFALFDEPLFADIGLVDKVIATRNRRGKIGAKTIQVPALKAATFEDLQILLYSTGIDPANGPKPLEGLTVLSVHGGGSLCFVRWTVEVCVNDCPTVQTNQIGGNVGVGGARRPTSGGRLGWGVQQAAALQPLHINGLPVTLSNRWTSRVQYDDKTECVMYVTQGRATFNAAALAKFSVSSPDQLRGSPLPLPPPGTKRLVPEVMLSPDGLTLEYTIIDRESPRSYVDHYLAAKAPAANLPLAGPFQRNVENISLVVKKESMQAIKDLSGQVIRSITDSNWAFGDQREKESNWSKWKRRGLKGITTAWNVVSNVTPAYVESAEAVCQGNRSAKMRDLQALAFSLVSGALGYGLNKNPNASVDNQLDLLTSGTLSLEYSPVDAWVKVTLTVERSGVTNFTTGDTQAAIKTMIRPLPDEIIGGELPYSTATLGKLIGADAKALADKFRVTGWGTQDIVNGQAVTEAFTELKNQLKKVATIGRENLEMILVTNEPIHERGPSGDGVSRSETDILIRAAAALLRPCQPLSVPTDSPLFVRDESQVILRPLRPVAPRPPTPYDNLNSQSQAASPQSSGSSSQTGSQPVSQAFINGSVLDQETQRSILEYLGWEELPNSVRDFLDPNRLLPRD